MTDHEKCSVASYVTCSDAAIVKECFMEAGNLLFQNKNDVVDTIQRIPISTTSSIRNTQVLADETYKTLKRILAVTKYFALALDESCDIPDTALLVIFVRYLDSTSEEFVEELLTILPISGTTTGEDLHKTVLDYFGKDSLNLKKLFRSQRTVLQRWLGVEKAWCSD
ncbi:zinc finger BED domain-containing protein 5-like [Diabrotica undecimpunctata]|uniref:zinc finger BED domain-containing protein 5-like n=1 Tax=Diabrotica undecimpunctata TaxID=50387 RepID=UPI003B63B6DD